MSSKRETPAEALSRLIAERMTKEKLLDPERADGFKAKLSAGKLKESDWRLEIESSSKTVKIPRKR